MSKRLVTNQHSTRLLNVMLQTKCSEGRRPLTVHNKQYLQHLTTVSEQKCTRMIVVIRSVFATLSSTRDGTSKLCPVLRQLGNTSIRPHTLLDGCAAILRFVKPSVARFDFSVWTFDLDHRCKLRRLLRVACTQVPRVAQILPV